VDSPGFDAGFGLTGKVALITGAAQGIGRAIADLYAERGARLVLVDMSEAVHDVSLLLETGGAEVLPVAADLTAKGSIAQVVDEALAEYGQIDILVNNAGVALLDEAERLSEEWWDKTISVNLTVPFLLSQQVARAMITARRGKIVNIASQASVIALDRHVAYCASKAGLVGMTKVLAVEWAEYGITVNAISPTVVLTELGKAAWAGEVGEAMKKKIPVGRFARPEEIATAALFLASEAADMITGENLIIDGGYTIA